MVLAWEVGTYSVHLLEIGTIFFKAQSAHLSF